MSDLTHLLAEIIETPAEDSVRLAFADALQSRGDPGDEDWADFIRTQIETHATENEGGLSRSIKVMKGQHLYENSGVHQKRWLGGVHNVTVPGSDWKDTYAWWSRGFPELVRCDWAAFSRYGGTFLWNRKRTMTCPSCRGYYSSEEPECPECYGNCRVRRPCTIDHRPVRQVTLKDYPGIEYKMIGTLDGSQTPVICGQNYTSPVDATEKEILEMVFPGVTFFLPKLTVEVALFDPRRTHLLDKFPQSQFNPQTVEAAGWIAAGHPFSIDPDGRVRQCSRGSGRIAHGVTVGPTRQVST